MNDNDRIRIAEALSLNKNASIDEIVRTAKAWQARASYAERTAAAPVVLPQMAAAPSSDEQFERAVDAELALHVSSGVPITRLAAMEAVAARDARELVEASLKTTDLGSAEGASLAEMRRMW